MAVALGQLTEEGIWVSGTPHKPARPQPGLLLDRDGVLVEEVSYLHRPEDVRLVHGAVLLLRWAGKRKIPVAVVTNQAGIDRGLFGWDAFLSVQIEMTRQLTEEGVAIDLAVACPFHPDHTKAWNESHAHWRKPGPGMLCRAAQVLNLDLARSWMVGDNESDVAAAKMAGLAGAIHVMTGHGSIYRAAALRLASERFSVLPAQNLTDTLALLSEQL